MKTDDDIFVNMFALMKHLTDLYNTNFRSRLLMCLVWWRMHVLRKGKWGIPKEEMSDDVYPVYCSGMGYVMTSDVAIAMYNVSFHVKFFWVDDVYISGLLIRGLEGSVNHTDLGRAYCGAHEMAVYAHVTEWYKYVFTHVHDETLYMQTWKELVQTAKRFEIPTPRILKPGVLSDEYIPKHVLFPEHRHNKKRKKRTK